MAQSRVMTTNINGSEYRIRPLPPQVALDLLLKIFKVAAPGVGNAVDEMGGSLEEVLQASTKDVKLGQIISGAAERLNGDDLKWACDLLARQTEVVTGQNEAPRLSDVYDVHFQGRIKSWFSWFIWAVKSQYSDFFEDSGNGAGPPV